MPALPEGGVPENEERPAGPPAARGRRRRSRALRRANRRRWPYPETYAPGNAVELFHDGGRCYAAMLEAIGGAERTVHMETYLLRSDETGWRFARALAAAADRGVEVAFMFDAIGGLTVSHEMVRFLHEHSVAIVVYHPPWPWMRRWGLWRRNHRKILAIDSEIGFVGGMNISDHHAPVEDGGQGWLDTHLRVEGPAAVSLDRLFVEEWVHQGGRALTEPSAAESHKDGVAMRVVENRFLSRRALVRGAYFDALKYAARRIWIENSYFVPDRRFIRALVGAARRGVDVRILVAGRTDVRLAKWAAEHVYERLLTARVRLFEWNRTVLHAKTAVVDTRWTTVGTFNLDHRSYRMNLEVNAMILDEGVAEQMEALFLEDVERSREILLAEWRGRGWFRRLRSWGAWLLRAWL